MQKGRKIVNKKRDKDYFKWTADFSHKFNIRPRTLMRGGIRL